MSALERGADLLARHIMDAAAGVVSSALGNEVRDALGLAALELPPLDRECIPCHGTGRDTRMSAEGNRFRCDACNGSGTIITEAGYQVLAFLQRHPANLTQVTFHSTHDHDERGQV